MKLAEIKQKIKDNVAKERVIAVFGLAVGVAGVVIAERNRRECTRLVTDFDYFVEKKDESRGTVYSLPPIGKQLMDEMRAGATLMFREKKSRNPDGGSLGQYTTLPEWPEDANEKFEAF